MPSWQKQIETHIENIYNILRGTANNTLIEGNVTLTGTAQRLSATSIECVVITLQSEPTNTTNVYVGKSTNVSSTVHMLTLLPGESVTLTIDNVNKVYIIGALNDKVCYGGETNA